MRHTLAPSTSLLQAFALCKCSQTPKTSSPLLQAMADDGLPVLLIWLDGPEDKVPRYIPGGYAHPRLKGRSADAYLGPHVDRRHLLETALQETHKVRVIEVLRATHIGNRAAEEDEVIPVPQAYGEMLIEKQGDEYLLKFASRT